MSNALEVNEAGFGILDWSPFPNQENPRADGLSNGTALMWLPELAVVSLVAGDSRLTGRLFADRDTDEKIGLIATPSEVSPETIDKLLVSIRTKFSTDYGLDIRPRSDDTMPAFEASSQLAAARRDGYTEEVKFETKMAKKVLQYFIFDSRFFEH